MGTKINSGDESGSVKISETLNNLAIPVLFKYKVTNTGLGIYIGPQYSYLLSAKGSGSISSADDTEDMETSGTGSNTDSFNRSEFSGIFGLEYYFPCNFGISARYQAGFTNVAKKDPSDDSNSSVKNHGFTFTVGYRF